MCTSAVCVLLCVSLSFGVCVSHGTLLPLYLSTPECNWCSGGVEEVIKEQRVQGQGRSMEITHTQAAAHL